MSKKNAAVQFSQFWQMFILLFAPLVYLEWGLGLRAKKIFSSKQQIC